MLFYLKLVNVMSVVLKTVNAFLIEILAADVRKDTLDFCVMNVALVILAFLTANVSLRSECCFFAGLFIINYLFKILFTCLSIKQSLPMYSYLLVFSYFF